MKKENNSPESNNRKYLVYICSYVAFCFVTLSACILILNSIIEKNNVNQMNETIGLIAEKVNVSFDMMTKYVEQQAGILSVQENLDLEKEYQMLQNLGNDMDYISLGVIGGDGNMYCKAGEKIDFEKLEYDKLAVGNEKLYITEPYLSCVTGSNVITMFAPIYQNDAYTGSLFVTYPLECVQNLAQTNILKHDVESYLMNGLSGNYITCSNSVNNTAGVWGNLTLIKKDMHCLNGYDYNDWLGNMNRNSEKNVLCYEMNGIEYTQAYIRIDSMENWYVVVRIPNLVLANTMHQYILCAGVSAGILIVGTMIFAFLLYFNEYRQKKKIQKISEFDALTNLLNRRAFNKKIEEIAKNPDDIKNSVYIFIDIDFFKEFNDNYGHAAGDEILQKSAAAMRSVFAENGYVSRIGGDEFNVFMPDVESDSSVEDMIRRYQSKTAKIVLSDGTKAPVQCSIGVARYDAAEDDLNSLTVHADEALYYIKRNGKNNFCWYSDIDSKTEKE